MEKHAIDGSQGVMDMLIQIDNSLRGLNDLY
jgi:hypothetical protein